jgi:hypothetical protein
MEVVAESLSPMVAGNHMTLVAVVLLVDQPVLLEEVAMEVVAESLSPMVSDSFPLAMAAEDMMAAATILVSLATNSFITKSLSLRHAGGGANTDPVGSGGRRA